MQMTETPAPLRWSGDVDFATVDHLRDRITIAIADPDTDSLVIDLADVGFIDSMGLGLLVFAYNHCRPKLIDVVIRGAKPRTRHLLDFTGLDGLFSFEPAA